MPGLLLPHVESAPTSVKPTSRHALSGITNETKSSPPTSPSSTEATSSTTPESAPARTIHDIQLFFDPSPGAFVRVKNLGPDLVIARELDYHWCRGKSSARLLCLKICRKAEQGRQSVINELVAYRTLVKKDIIGTAFILRLDGVFEDVSRLFMAFNFVQRSLADALIGPRSDITHYKIQWVAQIVLGLSAIHTCGIIHRDLKPSNIFLDADNNIRIAGFDSSFIKDKNSERQNIDPGKRASSSSSSSSSSSPFRRRRGSSKLINSTPATHSSNSLVSDEVRGTWPYMAPEILANAIKRFKIDKRMYTKAVDYWSLGCLVYEVETGESLFGNFGDITHYGRCKDDEKYHRFVGLDENTKSIIYGLTRIDATKRLGDPNLRKHPYFRDENGGIEFKKWSKYRPPPPKSRPETYIHVEPDDGVSSSENPTIYRPTPNYAETIPGENLLEVLSQNPSDENNIYRRSERNKAASRALHPTIPSEESPLSEGEWILDDHCWINPRGIWGVSAGRGMPDKDLVLYETRS